MVGRPRKLCPARERVFLEEVRFGRLFSAKKIRGRYGLSESTFNEYVSKARKEGRL